MDDRRKLIEELEQRKREQAGHLDSVLIRFGEAILGRVPEDFHENSAAFGELAVYRRLCGDIAGSEVSIQTVEEQIQRFKELEENIEIQEREVDNGTRELAVSHGRLGKLLLDTAAVAAVNSNSGGGGYADFCAPYRDNADALFTKVLSLEERLSGLEQREKGNVFTWIGKNAQSLVLRSFLTKAQEDLEQLRRNVGERYARQKSRAASGGGALPGIEFDSECTISEAAEIEYLCEEIEQKQDELNSLSQKLSELREEKTNISGSYNAEGGPLKRIQMLKNHIAHVRDDLKGLYKSIGADAASINPSTEITAERRQIIDSFVEPGDKEAMDNAVRISGLIHEDEAAIEKLQISIAIDEEQDKIEKYRKMIQSKKEKIAQAERSIVELENGISDSEAIIQKLRDRE